ncbi:response regulator [Zeaxanthinibacter enoshimensis]|uniref:dolichyl-phosphate beta-glucosyltransferase n=1 Tax=Zeaxanthinibacter enoshimensis TaxID=392009 RepID=A0A4R6TRG2_9FLAO|nr:response regulator [Zeaxanthinibacter enoshimensis]TDQ31080.1 glycosyl transferase family 2 [Zeaxanthinibacter enoshimensis]
MKILAIDDQPLILLSVEKRLTEMGHTIKTAPCGEHAMMLFDFHEPDLVILDINMPDISGLEVIRHIRVTRKSDVPVLVMSGNTDEKTILKGFELGINDYMKKPVTLNEMAARVQRIAGKSTPRETLADFQEEQVLQEYCVGVIIPCYNEEERLSSADFKAFTSGNLGYHLCFVNDGSTDNTLQVLEALREGNEDHISIYNCEKNGGKAEAVRLGIRHMVQDPQYDFIGYLDADLSTDFSDFDSLVQTIKKSEYKIVSGSRINRMGANISKDGARKLISKSINLIIQKILHMPFKDTQCGAKIMRRDVAQHMFTKKFITRWLFDVEIFMRMRKFYGKEQVQDLICEKPLNRWIHADGSKLSMKDSFRIVGQLAQIATHYR